MRKRKMCKRCAILEQENFVLKAELKTANQKMIDWLKKDLEFIEQSKKDMETIEKQMAELEKSLKQNSFGTIIRNLFK
jgi:hypothetical protein